MKLRWSSDLIPKFLSRENATLCPDSNSKRHPLEHELTLRSAKIDLGKLRQTLAKPLRVLFVRETMIKKDKYMRLIV